MLIKREKVVQICDKIIEFCIYGFVFFLPISNALIEVCVGWSIFALLVKKITQKSFLKNPLSPFIGLYFLSLLISTLFSSYIPVSLYTVFAKILHYVAFYFVVAEIIGDKRILKNTVLVLSFSLLLICIDGIQQYFTYFDFIRQRKWPWNFPFTQGYTRGRISACFTSANGLGAYLAPMSILAFSFAPIFKRRMAKLFFMTLFILSLVCLLLTFSRGAWFAFFFGFLFFIALSKKRKAIILCCLSVTVLFLLFYLSRQNFFTVTGLNVGLADRIALWQMSWNMFKGSPIWGQGIGTFMQNFSKYSLVNSPKQVCYAHSSFFQLLAETGILGLGSMCLIILVTFYKSIKKYLNTVSGWSIVHLGFISALFGFVTHAFFDNHLYSLTFSLLFWFLVGVNIALLKDANN